MRDSGGEDEREVATEVSAGLAPWVPFQLAVKRTVTRRWKERGEQFHQDVIDSAGITQDDLAQAIEESETLTESYVQAGEKATRSTDADFRMSLARLVAAGFRDDAKVDESAFFVTVLTQLEPVHLRLLTRFGLHADQDLSPPSIFILDGVVHAMGIPIDVATSVAERLHALSLLTDRRAGDMQNWSKYPTGAYGITDTGQALLRLCRGIDKNADTSEEH